MRNRIVITIILLASYLYCLSLVFFGNAVDLSNNIFFGILSTSSVFILPAILSKLVGKKSYFGIGYILATLIYPITYFIIYLCSKWFGLDSQLLYRAFSFIFFTFTILSLTFLVFKKDFKHYVSLKRSFFTYILIFASLIGIYALLNIKTNALLSTDFLQHNAVVQEMSNGKLCLTPNQCSNLFQKLGYTTYFHSIQAFITVGFNLSTGIASTMMNFAFISISFLVILKIFKNYLKDNILAILGTLMAIFVFEVGAYSFAFAIPQTFALLLFLNLISEKKLVFKNLLFSSPVLFSCHFILGPIFILFGFIYYIFTRKLNKDYITLKVLSMVSVLGVLVAFLANFRGFSIEKFFQLPDVNTLGSFSNYYFPENLIALYSQYGFLLIFFLVAAVYFFIKKKSVPFVYYAITYVSICLIFFFLAPTYASKFLIGTSVFISFLIVSMFNNLKLGNILTKVILIFILFSSLSFYILNIRDYSTFYTQNSGKISAITKDDNGVITFLKGRRSIKCQIVSDPYTQLMVRSQTLLETAGGQYQSLETRKAIVEFAKDPNNTTYENLMTQKDISNRFCLLYTSRMGSVSRYVNSANIPWLNNLYDYDINNNYGLDNSELIDFMLSKEFHIIFSDSNNLLFSKE